MKQETLDWLADHPFDTKRCSFCVGHRCQTMTVQDVVPETHRAWGTIRDLEREYMREPLRRAGPPAPTVVGIDAISIRKGHTYRIVVSDLERRRSIWFEGNDRSDEKRDECSQWRGSSKSKKSRLAVRDMWTAFRHAPLQPEHAPQAARLFDKFHVIRYLGEALDTVRTTDDSRLTGKDRRGIKGQKYTRRSHRETLTPEAPETAAQGEETFEHGVPPQGGIRAALGLRAGRLGASFLRALVRVTHVAAPEALREVRRDDRPALGWHRGLLQT